MQFLGKSSTKELQKHEAIAYEGHVQLRAKEKTLFFNAHLVTFP